jgi:Glycosyl hydrolase family 76
MAVRRLLPALLLACTLAGPPAGVLADSSRAQYLDLAAGGIRGVESTWWNPQVGWYGQIPYSQRNDAKNVATVWDAYGFFEALDLLAIAEPTQAHLADVERFGRGAERYWDAYSGGYWFSLDPPRGANLFFDDNGWLGLAYFDAYAATKDPRFLGDALRAYRFIRTKGWDRKRGGVWWDTNHDHKTIEPLAAEVLLGVELYRATHAPAYLREARALLSWAKRHSWNRARGLYQRNSTSDTVMDYVQGMIIQAETILCKTVHERSACLQAVQLGHASLESFPRSYHWAPETDAIYLRGLLQLGAVDGSRHWFAEADYWGRQAVLNSPDGNGLLTKDWTGGPSRYRLLRPGGTLMLLTSLAVGGNAKSSSTTRRR